MSETITVFARVIHKPEYSFMPSARDSFLSANHDKIVKLTLDPATGRLCNMYGTEILASQLGIIMDEHEVKTTIWNDVLCEVKRARNKHKGNSLMLAATIEEHGEMAQAMIDTHRGTDSIHHAYEEAIQLMAVTLRVILESSTEFNFSSLLDGDKRFKLS